MGASLPAASRWVRASPEGVGTLGLLYGANTVGAVIGCLLAGFYLLRVFDMGTATFVAAAINVTVGLVSFWLAKSAPDHKKADDSQPAIALGAWPVYVTIALSGATALGAEVIWTRLLGLMLGATVYTFSISPGGSSWWGSGQAARGGFDAGARRKESQGAAGLEPDAAGGGRGVDGVHAVAVPALLADQPAALHESVVHLPDRYGAVPVGVAAGGVIVGRELPAGAGGRGERRRRPGPPGGRHLRGQYGRRHRGRALGQHDPGAVDRDRTQPGRS